MSKEVWIGIGIFAAFALSIGVSLLMDRRRRKALQAVADSLNLAFSASSDPEDLPRGNELLYFNAGSSSKSISNLMRGSVQGGEVVVFDCRKTSSGSKGKSTERTLALFQAPGMPLPGFVLMPENFVTRFAQKFGLPDINFDSDPAFSDRYLLQGSDEAAIRELFPPEVRAFFAKRETFYVEAKGDVLLVSQQTQKKVRPGDLQAFLAEAQSVFALFRQRVS